MFAENSIFAATPDRPRQPRPVLTDVSQTALPQPSKISIRLSPQAAASVAAFASRLTADPFTDQEGFCEQANRLARELPAPLRAAVTALAAPSCTAGVLVVSGLEVGHVPATPPDNTRGIGRALLLTREQAIIGALLGDHLAYEAEGHGHLFQDMVPNAELADTQQSQGSRAELEAHTEQCFSPLRPHYLSLACHRGHPDAATYFMTVNELAKRFTADELAQLSSPRWITFVDESFLEHVTGPARRGPMGILGQSGGQPQLLVDQDLMNGIDDKAHALLQKVIRCYVEHRERHTLQSGDLLFLNNRKVIHGRSPFPASFDGRDRFVSRGFIVEDILPFVEYLKPGSRVVASRCS